MPDALRYWELPHGHTIFCDDIRSEVGGKTSLMGIYNGTLYTAQPLPQTLRLAFAVTYHEPTATPAAQLVIRLTYVGDDAAENLIFEAKLDGAEARESAIPPPDSDESQNLTLMMAGLIDRLEVPGPGRLKSRLFRDGEEIRLGTLRIEHREAANASSMAA